MGGVPILFVVPDGDIAEGGLTVGGIEEQLGGATELVVELCEVARIGAGIPLKGDIEVEEQQRALGANRDDLRAWGGDGDITEACHAHDIGGIERGTGRVRPSGLNGQWDKSGEGVTKTEDAVAA